MLLATTPLLVATLAWQILRLLENEEVTAEEVDAIKDRVLYYIEAHQVSSACCHCARLGLAACGSETSHAWAFRRRSSAICRTASVWGVCGSAG